MKPKAIIQVTLHEDNKLSVNATSQNHITNMGMLEMAKTLLQRGVEVNKTSPIVLPEMS